MAGTKADVAVIGLGVMGWNLACNLVEHGFSCAIYNRSADKTLKLAAENANFVPCTALDALVAAVAVPRKILIMVPAGAAVDAVLDDLLPLLDTGDVVIDGGNTYFPDTVRRGATATARGIEYLGLGVSGGEVGARRGPSMMAGGSPAAWAAVKPLLEAIAARTPEGEVCVDYFGSGGAGHFIKMVHNGIEYAIMEIIAEVYWLLKHCNRMSDDDIAAVFKRWNGGALQSYLLEISSVILKERDSESGQPLIEMMRDNAKSKGTGIWCCQVALELGVAVPTIYEALAMRQLSENTAIRDYGRGRWDGQPTGTPVTLEALEWAFYASTVMAYSQGFALLHQASESYQWDFDFAAIAKVWRAGCIIRAAMLNRIRNAYTSEPDLPIFSFSGDFSRDLTAAHPSWCRIVAQATTAGLPLPGMGSALEYFDIARAELLPTNLLQAQRDYFGAHQYERIDRPRHETFHHQWPEFRG